MKKESKNLISESAHKAFKQLEILETARGADLEKELKRTHGMKEASEIILGMADKQLEALRLTGFLPDGNIFLDEDEVKLVNAKRNLSVRDKKQDTHLLDEFLRK